MEGKRLSYTVGGKLKQKENLAKTFKVENVPILDAASPSLESKYMCYVCTSGCGSEVSHCDTVSHCDIVYDIPKLKTTNNP
jgi:hypothetical protein